MGWDSLLKSVDIFLSVVQRGDLTVSQDTAGGLSHSLFLKHQDVD